MSRVDEAMRRAAGEGSDKTTDPDGQLASSEAEVADVAALSRTSFPIEMPERRRARSAPAGAVVAERPASIPGRSDPGRSETPAAVAAEPPPTSNRSLLERIDSRLAQKVVVDKRIMPASREQYRRLAAALHHAQGANGTKVVMIASALPGEGKTLTASNLALTLSESYHRNVLLIDGDLRKPGLHSVFNVENTSGLSDGLVSVVERKLPVQEVTPRLSILTAGRGSGDPMAGLTSDRMRRVLDEAREGFDWIVIDTPPVAVLSDANLLARMVDAAVMVVKAGSTAFELVQRAIDAIGRDRTIGVVLNRANPAEDATGYAYYDSYYRAQVDTQP